ncbi:conjugal transfer protein TraA [Orientia tsutsugamushi]
MPDDKELNLEELGAKVVDLEPKFRTVKGQSYIIREVEMIHEKVKEIINAFFAKLGLSNRVDEISTVLKKLQKHIGPTRIRSLINEVANENELRKEANLKIIKDADVIKERTKTTVLSKIENWFKSIITDINDRSHVNEEYYHFTAKPEQEAKVEKVQQENSIKQCTTKDISTPLFMQIKEQRQYNYDVTLLSAEGKAISSFQEIGIDSRMVYSSNVNNLKYYQAFQGEKILIAANIAVKKLVIPEIMKLVNNQNIKIEPEQIVKADIAPKIGVRR